MKNKYFLSIFLFLFLAGCSKQGNIEDLKIKIGNKRAETIGEVENLPKFEEYKPYYYQSSNLKSPFQESIIQVDTRKVIMTEIRPEENREKSHLEEYNLDDFVMKGVINKEDKDVKAILFLKNDIHTVSVNDYIGKNNGKITSIDNEKIMIREIVQNGSYRWIERPAVIYIKK